MTHTLILVEHDGRRIKPSSLSGIALAGELGGGFSLLLVGWGVGEMAEGLRGFGARAVWVADDPVLAEPLADCYATVIVQVANAIGADGVVGTSSTFTKDVLPRVAALLDAPMVTDVTAVERRDGMTVYQRPVNAGSRVATVAVEGDRLVLSARGTAFRAPATGPSLSPVEEVPVDSALLPRGMEFESRAVASSERPDLTEARVVVAGGRPLGSREEFERLIGGLADALGGAVGSTRAAVDAGMASNDCQVGQTGKAVAPELYIGVGVSGAIQHLAGIQDSRVIVAINRDVEAPIFQVATYGLVGDLHEITPRLIKALGR